MVLTEIELKYTYQKIVFLFCKKKFKVSFDYGIEKIYFHRSQTHRIIFIGPTSIKYIRLKICKLN